eukprot:Skav206959  [mRNA]  locus=scaffold255:59190:73705:- [translate_table: standard]
MGGLLKRLKASREELKRSRKLEMERLLQRLGHPGSRRGVGMVRDGGLGGSVGPVTATHRSLVVTNGGITLGDDKHMRLPKPEDADGKSTAHHSAACGKALTGAMSMSPSPGMEDYREAQRAKWRAQKEAADATGEAAASAAVPAASTASSATERAVGSAASAARASASSEAGAPTATPNARRVHILPVHPCACEQDQRLSVLSPSLRQLRADQVPIKTGMFLRPAGYEFVVVKCEPDEAVLAMNTDYYIEGLPLKRFEKVQFVCLWDFERARTEQDATTLFRDYINPYFREQNSEDATSILALHERLPIQNMEFEVMAAEPIPPEIGIVDLNTVVYVDWDNTPEFSKIHFVPFQDTLPAAYDYDVFNDYLKPYLTRNKLQNFGVNDQFTFQAHEFAISSRVDICGCNGCG